MCGKEMIAEVLRSHYANTACVKYAESDDEIRFRVPAPLRDTQTAAFRSRAPVLNELAISHRLSLAVCRDKYGIPDDFAFAINNVKTVVHSIDMAGEYDVTLRLEAVTRRHGTISALGSTLVTNYGVEARTTTISFNVLPPSLANFVRRTRRFMEFADVKMSRDRPSLSTIAHNHFRYYPSESDRLSDGRRVDHVPALILIDIALFVDSMAHQGAVYANIAAEFLNYTDPRLAFDILFEQGHGAIEFVQDGRLVAVVHHRECPGSMERGDDEADGHQGIGVSRHP